MAEKACDCPTWSSLDQWERYYILADMMEWAWAIHQVDLTLLARDDHVTICELTIMQPGQGHARNVMEEICQRADCFRVPLELGPVHDLDTDLQRLAISLGFQSHQQDMIRYPANGLCH